MHGGGFVSQSSKSHEAYLRHWCVRHFCKCVPKSGSRCLGYYFKGLFLIKILAALVFLIRRMAAAMRCTFLLVNGACLVQRTRRGLCARMEVALYNPLGTESWDHAPFCAMAPPGVCVFHTFALWNTTSMLENLHATAPPFNRAYVLQVPIVSIDYSLAPEFPYPQAHHECFHVYAWVLRNAHKLGKSFFALLT